MESIGAKFNDLNISRSQSNHNLSCYVQFSNENRKVNAKNTNNSSTKKQKLDAILKSIKQFKNTQSTNDLHSSPRLSYKHQHNYDLSNMKEQHSFIMNSKDNGKQNQQKNQSKEKFILNFKHGYHKVNDLDIQKGQKQLSQSDQLANMLRFKGQKQLNSAESTKNLQSYSNSKKHQNFGTETSERITSAQRQSKPLIQLDKQKNSLEAIKQKLQKYGIKLNGNNGSESRFKFVEGSRIKNLQLQHLSDLNQQGIRNLLKSNSNGSLIESQNRKQIDLLLKSNSTTNLIDIQNKRQVDNQNFKSYHDQSSSRPLTSLKEKDVSFHQKYQVISKEKQSLAHNEKDLTRLRQKDILYEEQITSSLKHQHHKEMSDQCQNDQKRISPMKSVTSNNSITSAKAHARNFNFNMQNFACQKTYNFNTSTNKKPGSYGNNQKSKFTDADSFGTVLKEKPGSYGNKKSLKSVFDPTSSFSKNSNISSYELADCGLKQTIETDCTAPKLQKILSIKDFTLGRQIGKGKFGRVFLCTHNVTGFLSAIKIIKKDMIRKERNIEQLIRQIKIQMFLNHSNSVRMYTFFDDAENIYLLIEYCIEGQLYTLLKTKKKFEQEEAIPIIKDICEGLGYLHSQNIIHRDIKPENVVMSFKLSKLCDFGWSVNSQNQKRETFCGTPLYVSPELLMGKTYDYKVDIWALGIMVYELLTGKLPFHITNQKQLKKIVTNQVKYPEHLSQNAKSFIQHLLQKNPAYRNDIETILKHRFLVDGMQRIKNKNKV